MFVLLQLSHTGPLMSFRHLSSQSERHGKVYYLSCNLRIFVHLNTLIFLLVYYGLTAQEVKCLESEGLNP